LLNIKGDKFDSTTSTNTSVVPSASEMGCLTGGHKIMDKTKVSIFQSDIGNGIPPRA